MALNQNDIAALMKGVAPAIRDHLAKQLKPLADLIVEQGRANAALRERVELLERQAKYEVTGTSQSGKPRVKKLT